MFIYINIYILYICNKCIKVHLLDIIILNVCVEFYLWFGVYEIPKLWEPVLKTAYVTSLPVLKHPILLSCNARDKLSYSYATRKNNSVHIKLYVFN